MRFFLGTHQPHWLSDERFEGVPLFISRRRLNKYRTLPRAVTDFALDSGGFTELQIHGRWITSADTYAVEALHYASAYGRHLKWIAPQDWMCEPIVIAGGSAGRGIVFAGTGLSVEEHQRRTVKNFVQLRSLLKERVVPVLQGWRMIDYWRCCQMYQDAGVRLADERVVGVGTMCRRQSTEEAAGIMRSLADDGLSLHGFGFKKAGLRALQQRLTSADSTAWSDVARRDPICLKGHDQAGPGRPRGHKNCANCAEYALLWRAELLESLEVVRAA